VNRRTRRHRLVFLAGGWSAGILAALIPIIPFLTSQPVQAIPAFARKYGLPCSACHEAWPKLNNFGQVFRDNGYQLGNDKDSPIMQQPTYWPMSVRITPTWHRESNNRVAADTIPGVAGSGLIERQVSTSGFDVSGMDLWFAGTLAKNISFQVLPSADPTGSFRFESAWVRFDNLLGSSWLNLKFGKHELDTPISEKRFLALTSNGGIFQVYHFSPAPISSSPFALGSFLGIGNNQLGIELMGHSSNSYTRYAFSLVGSNSGQPNLPTSRTYDYYFNVNQAFELPKLGLQRIGTFVYYGFSPTYSLTKNGVPLPGTGLGNRSFYRAGVYGIWYAGKFDFSTLFLHGKDNVFIGTGTPSIQPLQPGAQSPTWNGGFIETHYTVSPQLIFIQRVEAIRFFRQALVSLPADLDNIDALTFGYRWYPFMHSRAGLALHQEYSWLRSRKTSPVNGLDSSGRSLLLGFDFAF
jgi:hypothetical protein